MSVIDATISLYAEYQLTMLYAVLVCCDDCRWNELQTRSLLRLYLWAGDVVPDSWDFCMQRVPRGESKHCVRVQVYQTLIVARWARHQGFDKLGDRNSCFDDKLVHFQPCLFQLGSDTLSGAKRHEIDFMVKRAEISFPILRKTEQLIQLRVCAPPNALLLGLFIVLLSHTYMSRNSYVFQFSRENPQCCLRVFSEDTRARNIFSPTHKAIQNRQMFTYDTVPCKYSRAQCSHKWCKESRRLPTCGTLTTWNIPIYASMNMKKKILCTAACNLCPKHVSWFDRRQLLCFSQDATESNMVVHNNFLGASINFVCSKSASSISSQYIIPSAKTMIFKHLVCEQEWTHLYWIEHTSLGSIFSFANRLLCSMNFVWGWTTLALT